MAPRKSYIPPPAHPKVENVPEATIKKEEEKKEEVKAPVPEEEPVVDQKTQEEFNSLMEKGIKADEQAALRYMAFQNKLREQQLL